MPRYRIYCTGWPSDRNYCRLSTIHDELGPEIEAASPLEAAELVVAADDSPDAPLFNMAGFFEYAVEELPLRLYEAGPMTDHPQFNFPLFDATAAVLRDRHDLEIRSPAELDDPKTRAAALASPDGAEGSGSPNGDTWGDFLARDVKLIADEVDGVVVLPEWWTSKGARLEVYCAHLSAKPVYHVLSILDRGVNEDAQLSVEEIEQGVHGTPPDHRGDSEGWSLDALRGVLEELEEAKLPGAPLEDLIKPAPDTPTLTSELEFLYGAGPKFTAKEIEAYFVPVTETFHERLDRHIKEEGPLLDRLVDDEYWQPTANEERITSETGGQKGRKPERLDLVPPEFTWLLGRVFAMGAEKYDDNNYLKGYPWSLSYAAGKRHLEQWWNGQDLDDESGLNHLGHAAWHLVALYMFQLHELGTDDRLGTVLRDLGAEPEQIGNTGRSEETR